MIKILIYTDGACKGNPGIGGYGYILECPEKNLYKESFEGYKLTTNNRMELLAVIEALKQLKTNNVDIEIFSDSQYICNCIEKKWLFSWEKNNFKGKKNSDLWKEFLLLYKKFPSIKFNWVKGHNNHPKNEKCDSLANLGCKKDILLEDNFFLKERTNN